VRAIAKQVVDRRGSGAGIGGTFTADCIGRAVRLAEESAFGMRLEIEAADQFIAVDMTGHDFLL
jgi:hypothetical protein